VQAVLVFLLVRVGKDLIHGQLVPNEIYGLSYFIKNPPERIMKNFSGEQPLILVIEEKQEVLQEVTSALADNYTICSCTTAEAALAAAEVTPPAMIICDASLKNESGLELCERIRQYPGLEFTPLMFLSGGQLPDIIRRHDSLGGAYHLRKPLDRAVLSKLVDQALQMPALAAVSGSEE
jgi:CheY-like chemotaxis protein